RHQLPHELQPQSVDLPQQHPHGDRRQHCHQYDHLPRAPHRAQQKPQHHQRRGVQHAGSRNTAPTHQKTPEVVYFRRLTQPTPAPPPPHPRQRPPPNPPSQDRSDQKRRQQHHPTIHHPYPRIDAIAVENQRPRKRPPRQLPTQRLRQHREHNRAVIRHRHRPAPRHHRPHARRFAAIVPRARKSSRQSPPNHHQQQRRRPRGRHQHL